MERNSKFVCECGGATLYRHRFRHYKGKRHQKYELKKKQEEKVAKKSDEEKEHDRQMILNKKELYTPIIVDYIICTRNILNKLLKESKDAPSMEEHKKDIERYMRLEDPVYKLILDKMDVLPWD